MPAYVVGVLTRQGFRKVEFTAKNEMEARATAARMGNVLTVEKRSRFRLTLGLTHQERQVMFSRLAAMLNSRVGTSEALRVLRDSFGGRISQASAKLLAEIEAGADLPQAFERVGMPHFPDAVVALITAGARAGSTGDAIQEAANFERLLVEVRTTAGKGFWGALGAFLAAAAATLVSTLYIGPKVMATELMQQMADRDTLHIAEIAGFAGEITSWVMGGILGTGAMLALFAFVGRRLSPISADRVILKIPVYRELLLCRSNFITLFALARLVGSGVRIEDSLRITADSAPPGMLRDDIRRAESAVRAGRPWAQQLTSLHATDKAALASSIDRAQTAKTLEALSAQYRNLYVQVLELLVPALQLLSALFLSIAGAVLFGQGILPLLAASAASI